MTKLVNLRLFHSANSVYRNILKIKLQKYNVKIQGSNGVE